MLQAYVNIWLYGILLGMASSTSRKFFSWLSSKWRSWFSGEASRYSIGWLRCQCSESQPPTFLSTLPVLIWYWRIFRSIPFLFAELLHPLDFATWIFALFEDKKVSTQAEHLYPSSSLDIPKLNVFLLILQHLTLVRFFIVDNAGPNVLRLRVI